MRGQGSRRLRPDERRWAKAHGAYSQMSDDGGSPGVFPQKVFMEPVAASCRKVECAATPVPGGLHRRPGQPHFPKEKTKETPNTTLFDLPVLASGELFLVSHKLCTLP